LPRFRRLITIRRHGLAASALYSWVMGGDMRRIQATAGFVFLLLACLSYGPGATVLAAEVRQSIELPVSYIEARLRGPLDIVEREQARPSIEGDRSFRVVLAGQDGGANIRVKMKPVAPPGEGFNNEPRYDLAAYKFQKMFLDECEYVVPPIAMRAVPLAEYRNIRSEIEPTLRMTSSVLVVLSYWLSDVSPDEPWDPARFENDPRYARHWGNLNLLTHLIDHKDENYGNLLISKHPEDPRVFSVDNDVAFDSRVSDKGAAWRELLVTRFPERSIERLRGVSLEDLQEALGVLVEFRVDNGALLPVEPPGEAFSPRRGLRSARGRVQFGLTTAEIQGVKRRIDALLQKVDQGQLATVTDSQASLGLACLAAVPQ
jgi:hypothetical protein